MGDSVTCLDELAGKRSHDEKYTDTHKEKKYNKKNTTETQTLSSSLTDFALHISSSFFTALVQTLQILIHTHTALLLLFLRQWLVDGCPTPTDVFSQHRKVKTFVHIVRHIFCDLKKKRGHQASHT